MKYIFLSLFLFFDVSGMTQGQTKITPENVVITSKAGKTRARTDENGELLINVTPKDLRKFKTRGLVRYSDFGARGDGKTDDIDVIAATHAFANQYYLSVKADEGGLHTTLEARISRQSSGPIPISARLPL